MKSRLTVSIGQCSQPGDRGRNDDFHGAVIPDGAARDLKGITLAIADGISTSDVSAVASGIAVRAFLEDYYDTPDSWSVKTAASRVIAAANAWLHAETRRTVEERDRGYVCTLSGLVLKGTVAHIFHVGDARVSRLAGRALEQLTEDHRLPAASQHSYLARALGAAPHVEIDYRAVPLEPGDVFALTTDGVHDHLPPDAIAAEMDAPDLDAAAHRLVSRAAACGSRDDRTVQFVRIETLPLPGPDGLQEQAAELPPAPLLEPGDVLDGYRVLRTLHDSARSHLYLVATPDGLQAVMKIPSIDLRGDPAYLGRFMLEEWVARRINSPHVVKAYPATHRRTAAYLLFEFLDGETLAQWMRDHPAPALEPVRAIVDQIARGLDAFHRREMVHGDLRPENVMLDPAGTARIIDLGSVRVAGLADLTSTEAGPLGTLQYTAPECLLGAPASPAGDVYALAALTFHALTGRLPFPPVDRARDLRRRRYRSARARRPEIPPWVDGALARALDPSPARRHASAIDFAHDLRHPNPDLSGRLVPWLERDPVLFWKALTLALALALVILAAARFG